MSVAVAHRIRSLIQLLREKSWFFSIDQAGGTFKVAVPTWALHPLRGRAAWDVGVAAVGYGRNPEPSQQERTGTQGHNSSPDPLQTRKGLNVAAYCVFSAVACAAACSQAHHVFVHVLILEPPEHSETEDALLQELRATEVFAPVAFPPLQGPVFCSKP